MSVAPPPVRKAREVVSFAFRHPENGKVNEKQCEFYDKVMLSVAGRLLTRLFFYGGAIRGGKTYVCLFILVTLARMFPRSRWHIIRSSFTELEDTTIPSMEKLIGLSGKDFLWRRRQNNYHIHFSNGSKIFFKSEKASEDPELGWMLGLETNGILLEQMEGISEKCLDRAIERVGSWYIPRMPPPLIFGTFNPTDRWVKKKIYDRAKDGTLPENWEFIEALPDHNPYVTAEQWANWNNLDEISRNQMIKGIWKFLTDAKVFAYAFNSKKTVIDVARSEKHRAFMTPNRKLPLWIYFDFNVDPMTALVCQHDGLKWFKVYAEYRLRNSDIFEVCARIRSDWDGYYFKVSGDASGRARNSNVKGARSAVQSIKRLLRLSPVQVKFPLSNPSVKNTRVLLNSLLHNHPHFYISSECVWLIDDLESVKVNDKGEIDKTKDARKTHLLDNLRYFTWQAARKWIRGMFEEVEDDDMEEAA